MQNVADFTTSQHVKLKCVTCMLPGCLAAICWRPVSASYSFILLLQVTEKSGKLPVISAFLEMVTHLEMSGILYCLENGWLMCCV